MPDKNSPPPPQGGGDGWLDEMLLNFWIELTKKAADLFLKITDVLKEELRGVGLDIYRSGIDRLNPEPPITREKIIGIAGDAVADAIAEKVLITSSVIPLQMIPFLNLGGLNEILQTFSDLSPDEEIARVTTRTMVNALVREPLEQFYNSKFRTRALSEGEARRLLTAGVMPFSRYLSYLPLAGYRDEDIVWLGAAALAELREPVQALKVLSEEELTNAYIMNVIGREEFVKRLQVLLYEPRRVEVLVAMADAKKIRSMAQKTEPIDETAVAIKAAEEADKALAQLKKWGAGKDVLEPFQALVDLRHKRAIVAIRTRFGRDIASAENEIRAARLAMQQAVSTLAFGKPLSFKEDSLASFEEQLGIVTEAIGVDLAKVIPPRPTENIIVSPAEWTKIAAALATGIESLAASPTTFLPRILRSVKKAELRLSSRPITPVKATDEVPLTDESVKLLGNELADAISKLRFNIQLPELRLAGLPGVERVPTPPPIAAPRLPTPPIPRVAPPPTAPPPAAPPTLPRIPIRTPPPPIAAPRLPIQGRVEIPGLAQLPLRDARFSLGQLIEEKT